MKRIFTILVLLLNTAFLFAQNTNLSTATTVGRINSKSIRVYDEEKAYLLKDWNTGKVVFQNGKTEYLPINYNGYDNRLERWSNGQPYTIDQTVREFVLGDTSAAKGFLFKCGFEPIDGQGVLSFYQVMFEGKTTKLLKHVKFKTREKRNFNDANVTVNFDLYETYYFATKDGKMTRIKNNKKSVSEYFKNKDLDAFIESKNLKFKDWDDVVTVLNFTEGI